MRTSTQWAAVLVFAAPAVAQEPSATGRPAPADLTAEWLFAHPEEAAAGRGSGGRSGGRAAMRRSAKRKNASKFVKSLSRSLDDAVTWLQKNQQTDGRWTIEKPEGDTPGPRDVGTTGLVLQALVTDGNSLVRGEMQEPVRKAVLWLLRRQRDDGSFVDPAAPHALEDHIHATTALAEVVGLSRVVERPKPYVQHAVDYALAQRRDGLWWNGDDSSPTGHAFPMLRATCEFFGTEYAIGTEAAKTLATQAKTDRLAAMALFGNVAFCDPKDTEQLATIRDLAARVTKVELPWKKSGKGADYATALFAAHGLYQYGRNEWREWSTPGLAAVLVPQVRGSSKRRGSWPPAGDAASAGRGFATALGLITLQTFYRYGPFQRSAPWAPKKPAKKRR